MKNDKSKYEEDSAPDLTTVRHDNDTGETGFSKFAKPFRKNKPAINEITEFS